MSLYRISTSSLHRWVVVCLVLIACTGMPGWLAAALVTPEEVNSVRVYKQMAKCQLPSHYTSLGEGSRVWDPDR